MHAVLKSSSRGHNFGVKDEFLLSVAPMRHLQINSLTVKQGKSKYCPDEHLILFLDGIPLDFFLCEKFPKLNLEGLVPTFLNWMDVSENEVIWKRCLPKQGEIVRVPILMCPDDLDFYCTIIIAETMADHDSIFWKRLGIDASKIKISESVGEKVKWFKNVGPFHFDREAYIECLEKFRIDESKLVDIS